MDAAPLIVVMGVSGSGKSTVAGLLACRLSCALLEGDSLHSAANVKRMSEGVPLTDQDREAWLAAIALRLAEAAREGRGLVVACSALKHRYRDVLRAHAAGVVFVYLAGTREVLEERLAGRHGHFMPATLLDSQLATLEEPTADERVIRCDIVDAASVIVEHVMRELPPYMKVRS